MNLTHSLRGNGVEPGRSVETDVVRTDRNVVDVDKQSASAAPRELGQEACLAPAVLMKVEIVGRIFDEDLPSEDVLDPADIVGTARQHFVGARNGQEIGETSAVQARPGEMLRYERGLEAVDELLQC